MFAIADAAGIRFPAALRDFAGFIGGPRVDLLCNGGDVDVIADNCGWHHLDVPPAFRRATNLEQWLVEAIGSETGHVMSCDLPGLLGLDDSNEKHDALGDARSIAAALRKIGTWK